jgi:hypothetical protein
MPIGWLLLATKETFIEGTIRTSRGKHATNPPSWCANCQCFPHRQDRAWSRGGLANYKAHYGLSWFRPLLGSNRPTSNGLILKMNSGCNGASRELEKLAK